MSKDNTVHLKPCQCGAEAELRQDGDTEPCWVCCVQCTMNSGEYPDIETAVMVWNLRADSVAKDEHEQLKAKYYELIMAVAQKFPDETRHETALRYINQQESTCHGPESATQEPEV